MAKKNKQTANPVFDAFMECVNDRELQERYDRFHRDLEYNKSEYNSLVPLINANIQKIGELKDAILSLALNGVQAPEAIEALKKTEAETDEMSERIAHFKSKIDESERLIKKYKENSDSEKFTWWQAIKAVDPKTKPWMEWKLDYEDYII